MNASVREDPLTGEHVVIAPRRIPAPPAFAAGRLPTVARCPFCPGEEHHTGETIQAVYAGDAWVCRVFPNRRPALRPEEPDHGIGDGLLNGMGAVGAHEVLCESRDHDRVLEPRLAMHLAADRLEDLRRDGRFAAVTWFRNRGVEAGSSQPHPHSQIVAVPKVPPRIETIFARQAQHRGLMQQLIERAARDQRVIWEGGGVVAFTPWAPSAAFEVWVAPTTPRAWLSEAPHAIDGLADATAEIERRLHAAFGWCSHNSVLFDAPNRGMQPSASWHLRILPRLVPIAGFERWSGGSMNPIDPVHAAAVLRGFVT